MPQRIAFFGGTFDPPHIGHRAVALAAANHFAIDCMLLAPVGRQPLKQQAPVASFADRLAMVSILCEDLRSCATTLFEASELDAPRNGHAANYTIDSLRQLRGIYPSAELLVIVGADAFAELPRWREPEALLEVATWIVVSRPAAAPFDSASLPSRQFPGSRILSLDTVDVPVSATELRRRLGAGEDCSGLLPAGVNAYIHAHRLYASPAAGT